MTLDSKHDPFFADPEQAGSSSHAQALSQLMEAHNRALHAFLLMRVRDEQKAREIAQEAYVRLLQLHEPGAVSFMRAYLFKTAANIAINRAKQRQARGRIDRMDVEEERVDQLTPDRLVLAAEELEILKQALFELPPKCRRAFVLHRFQEWDQEQIARELGVAHRQRSQYCAEGRRIQSPARLNGFARQLHIQWRTPRRKQSLGVLQRRPADLAPRRDAESGSLFSGPSTRCGEGGPQSRPLFTQVRPVLQLDEPRSSANRPHQKVRRVPPEHLVVHEGEGDRLRSDRSSGMEEARDRHEIPLLSTLMLCDPGGERLETDDV